MHCSKLCLAVEYLCRNCVWKDTVLCCVMKQVYYSTIPIGLTLEDYSCQLNAILCAQQRCQVITKMTFIYEVCGKSAPAARKRSDCSMSTVFSKSGKNGSYFL